MNEGTYRYSKRNIKSCSSKTNSGFEKAGFSGSDSALILMLVMFLQNEEADLLLIMALLYILT